MLFNAREAIVRYQALQPAIAYAIAQGAAVVAAMGNAFQQGNPTSFPAAYPDVIAVGAIGTTDTRAVFSQTGPHIDVVAPGVGVFSTVWDNGFTNMSGTSMASPHVAGLAALILSCNGNLTAAQVADIIRQTASPLRDNPADPIPNNNYGFGCIDALAAINRACPRRSVPISTCPRQSTIVICDRPSLVVRCPTTTLLCTRPSVITLCPSVATRCPSVNAVCPTLSPVTCAQPSTVVLCPRPSVIVRCPSGPVCGIDPGRPPIERGQGGAAEGGPDPFGMNEWSDDDPYGGDYGGEGGYGGT